MSEEANFRITDDLSAEWAIKALKKESDECERLVKLAEDVIAEYQNKIISIREKFDQKSKFLIGCLAEYFMHVPHNETKTQSTYKLVSGTLVMKKPTQKIVHDDTILLQFIKNEYPAYVKIKESIDWEKFKKQLIISDNAIIDSATGEIVDGCSIEDISATFNVKFNKEED